MSVERSLNRNTELPPNVDEQLRFFPGFSERGRICEELFGQVYSLLDSEGIEIELEDSGYRAKTDGRIKEKIEQRASYAPIRDAFGLRFIVGHVSDREKVAAIIQDVYFKTPAEFADGTPSIRDYADSSVRAQNRLRNKNISDRYSALHINVVFERMGAGYSDIAEIQVMTKEELVIYNATREEYVNGK